MPVFASPTRLRGFKTYNKKQANPCDKDTGNRKVRSLKTFMLHLRTHRRDWPHPPTSAASKTFCNPTIQRDFFVLSKCCFSITKASRTVIACEQKASVCTMTVHFRLIYCRSPAALGKIKPYHQYQLKAPRAEANSLRENEAESVKL